MDDPSLERLDDDRGPDEFETGLPCATTDDAQATAFANQESQVNLMDLQPRKRLKSPKRPRKIKSAATQSIAPSVTARPPSQTELITPTVTRLTSAKSKMEETNPTGRNIITVDTSKARSNLEVVRMCVRELGWREVSAASYLPPWIVRLSSSLSTV